MTEWLTGAALIAVATLATWFDLKERRVPNALTVPSFAFAVLVGLLNGLPGLGWALAGGAICFLFALPLFLAGGLGGGDVKLLTAFGAFLGPDRLILGFVVMALVGGGLAVFEMVRRRAVMQTFRNLFFMAMTLGRGTFTGWKKAESEGWLTIHSAGAVTVPYALAISAGALFAWFY
jgi:prepilin peptidase CpaA